MQNTIKAMFQGRANRGSRLFLLMLAMCGVLTASHGQIWSEEFNYTSAPDSDVWSYDIGNWGWGNAELQDYTTSTNNVWVDGSNLVITARRSGSYFSSGRIKTLDKLTFKYGTVEARIQTPDLADGLWPAFWTLGNNFPSVGWPECGEIDVLEMGSSAAIAAGRINRRVASAAHWEHSGGHAQWSQYKDRPSNLNGSFHTYRLEWTPSSVNTFIDNNWIWGMDISGGAASDLEEFHEPHFFLFNLAVGGNYTGILNANGITAPFPAEYRIDWIRIYDNGHTVLGGTSTETPPQPGENLLDNPGFEDGLTGWNQSLGGGSAAVSAAYDHGGIDSLVIDSTGAGDWASPNVSQSFPASPGDVFNLQGYLLNPAGSPITGSSFGLFKIEFRDESGTVLDPASIDTGTAAAGPYFGAESTPKLTAGSATESWIFSEAQAEAPAGTATVGFYMLNVNQPGNLGPMHFDDVHASRVGDPSIPFSLSSSVTGGTVRISFPTQNGISYEVAFKDSLTNTTWNLMETIVGDGSTNTVTYALTNPASFFRVSAP